MNAITKTVAITATAVVVGCGSMAARAAIDNAVSSPAPSVSTPALGSIDPTEPDPTATDSLNPVPASTVPTTLGSVTVSGDDDSDEQGEDISDDSSDISDDDSPETDDDYTTPSPSPDPLSPSVSGESQDDEGDNEDD